MRRHRANTASTRNKHADVILAQAEVDRMFPAHEACAAQDMFCFPALADATTGTMYTDLTGAFTVRSFKNMIYIFVAYIYDLNAIIVRPMASCTDASFIAAFTEVFAILRARDYQPALNVMDNECSKAVEKHIRANRMTIQLVPLHNHRVNAAKRAIGTFKEHFVAALATIDNLCPLQLWDESLPQAELTLNMLRFSRRNPLISANHKLYGPFDFNKMPLALLGTKALVYNNPATWTSWAPHATNGFYVGPTTDHYHCLHFYIPATRRSRFSNTWHLYPRHCQVPTTLEHDSTLLAAADLLQHLGRAIPTMTTAKLKHLNAICQLTTIMSGQPNAPPPDPTSPRVVPATSPRVAVAAPPRVATTSNTITAPNTIRQLPIVHQGLTRHKNPFQILADDDNDKDTDTFVASNCSPRAPCPTQRPQPIQPPSHPPTTEPTTVWRPPPLYSRTILMPSQPLRLLPPIILTPRSRVRPRSPPTPSPQTLLFLPPVAPLLPHTTYGCIGTTRFLHKHQLKLHVTTSLSLTTTVMIAQLRGPPHLHGDQYVLSTLAYLVTLPSKQYITS
jgi:hypothetical protein